MKPLHLRLISLLVPFRPGHVVLSYAVVVLILHRFLARLQLPTDDSWLMWNFFQSRSNEEKLTETFTGEMVGEFSVPSIFAPYEVLDAFGALSYANLLTISAGSYLLIAAMIYLLLRRYGVRDLIAAPISIIFMSADLRTDFFTSTVSWQHTATVLHTLFLALVFAKLRSAANRERQSLGLTVLALGLLSLTFSLREPAVVAGVAFVFLYSRELARQWPNLARVFASVGCAQLFLAIWWRLAEPGRVVAALSEDLRAPWIDQLLHVKLSSIVYASVFLDFVFLVALYFLSRPDQQKLHSGSPSTIDVTTKATSRDWVVAGLLLGAAAFPWRIGGALVTLAPDINSPSEGATVESMAPFARWPTYPVGGFTTWLSTVRLIFILALSFRHRGRLTLGLVVLIISEYSVRSFAYSAPPDFILERHGLYLACTFSILFGLGVEDVLRIRSANTRQVFFVLPVLTIVFLVALLPRGLNSVAEEFERIRPISIAEGGSVRGVVGPAPGVAHELLLCPRVLMAHWLESPKVGSLQGTFPRTSRVDIEREVMRLGSGGIRQLVADREVDPLVGSPCWVIAIVS